ncbi:hypothetical protein Nepgr_011442 [Nepenthes gracilis]|uniref:Glutaredoxin domain-containing protein n=1 Tax=Nepenthes gracilis TaxID=150966 RepID=A0AAD3XME4_NEPGR|nr:hypothetical protein Nepgr_011442 [Nepenthes gracilis]
MGCVSSTFLNHDDEFPKLGTAGISHHIVSLTSTTYGLLTLDPPSQSSPSSGSATTPPPPPRRFTILSEPLTLLRSEPEVINSWEIMAGLDNDSFRFSPLPPPRSISSTPKIFSPRINKENSNPNRPFGPPNCPEKLSILKPERPSSVNKYSLDRFVKLCPPKGEGRVVLYTTTLRGVRKTFEACNAVRSAIEGLGVLICERDISMDRGFREELKELMRGRDNGEVVPPRLFVKGRYLGGAEQILKIHEEGFLGELLEGLPKIKTGHVCDGCGGARFLPCFRCYGSCKTVMVVKEEVNWRRRKIVVVKCSDCNENGLVLCPICS